MEFTTRTSKPIIFDESVNLSRYLNQYVNYYISFEYDNDQGQTQLYKMYYGKYFVSDPSRIRMNLSEALKNNINRVDWTLSTYIQDWLPDNLLPYLEDTQTITGVQSIENNKKFETVCMNVIFLDQATQRVIKQRHYNITSYFSPEWYKEFEAIAPTKVYNGKMEEANRSGILPRVPYLTTDKYYINFNFNRNRNSQPYYRIENENNNYVTVVTRNNGVYNFSMSLYRIFYFLHATESECLFYEDGGAAMRMMIEDITLDGGAAIMNESDDHGGQPAYIPPCKGEKDWNIKANSKPIVKVDNCYSRYYAAWFTPWGEWQSQPLDYMTANRINENVVIPTLRGFQYTAHTGSHGELTLRKNHLSTEEHKLYSTMMFSPYIFVYDTEKDRAYLGTYQGDITYNDRQRNNRDFVLRIKEVEKIKY